MGRSQRDNVAFRVGVPYDWSEPDEPTHQLSQWPPAREPPRSMARLREHSWPPSQSEAPPVAIRRRGSGLGWFLALAGLSFLAGVVVRDRLPAGVVSGIQSVLLPIANAESRVADFFAGPHAVQPNVPVPAAVPSKAPALVTASAPAESIVPEVSLSSLPRAGAVKPVFPVFRAAPPIVPAAPPRVRPMPVAAPVRAPEAKPAPAKHPAAHEQVVAPEQDEDIPEPTQPAVAEHPKAESPKAAVAEHAKAEAPKAAAHEAEAAPAAPPPAPEPPQAAPPKQPAVQIVPGSLEDLIRKEVLKAQGKK